MDAPWLAGQAEVTIIQYQAKIFSTGLQLIPGEVGCGLISSPGKNTICARDRFLQPLAVVAADIDPWNGLIDQDILIIPV